MSIVVMSSSAKADDAKVKENKVHVKKNAKKKRTRAGLLRNVLYWADSVNLYIRNSLRSVHFSVL